jgi:hypothetical protein
MIMTRKQMAILGIMALTAVFLLCVAPAMIVSTMDLSNIPTLTPPLPSPIPQPTLLQHNRVMAQIKCERFIKAQLKAPSTAKFYATKTYARENKPRNYHAVTGIVEAQNSFGIPIRSNYRCDVHYIPERPLEWILDGLEMK